MIDHDDLAELRAEVRAQRRYLRAICAHPDCRDPDHPGCATCMGPPHEHHNNQDET